MCFGDIKDTRGSKFTLPALKKYGLDINDQGKSYNNVKHIKM